MLAITPAIPAGTAPWVPASHEPGSEASTFGSALDQSWMHPGFSVEYRGFPLNAGISGSPIDFFLSEYRITGRNDALGIVSFSVRGSTLAGISVHAISVRIATREEAPGSGRYTPLWINDTNVATGEAWIGDQYATMTPLSNPVLYQFATSDQTFYYDHATGFLVGVANGGTLHFAFEAHRSD